MNFGLKDYSFVRRSDLKNNNKEDGYYKLWLKLCSLLSFLETKENSRLNLTRAHKSQYFYNFEL